MSVSVRAGTALLGVIKRLFGEEPLYMPVSSAAGGVEAAIHAILVALGKRLPSDLPTDAQPKAEPLEELVLELSDLKLHEQDGVRRAAGCAWLVYEPATPGQREVVSTQSWRLMAPLVPIEAEELRWYLEQYAIWPSRVAVIQDRARRAEANLIEWRKRLHEVAMPVAHIANVMQAWATISAQAGRRFSVHVESGPKAGVDAIKAAK